MTAADRLDEIQDRADAATDGPWEAYGTTIGAIVGPGDCGGCSGLLSPAHEPSCYYGEVAGASETDAVFIAHARADVPRLVAALRAVLDACSTYEKTQAVYRIEMGQREIIRVVRAEIEAALGEGS